MTVRNVLLTIEYDGTRFCGWQRQPNVRTVQGLLEETLTRVLGFPVTVDGTSRTDAGVHALGQRATFQGEYGLPVEKIPLVVNRILNGRTPEPGENSDLRILRAEEVPMEFHARYQCVGKTYVYRIWNLEEMPVFCRNYYCHTEKLLDIQAMNEAAAAIIGRHDFQCFQAAGSNPRLTTVRTIYGLQVRRTEGRGSTLECQAGPEVEIEVTGDGFLYNMVRIIAGTLIEIGLHRMKPEAAAEIIASEDRQNAGPTAPPQGLYLKEIYYDPERMKHCAGCL
ncbi:MAG: tRNA pseudouridine(38-40) synthase TruA [Eubacterium sp.]|mgnify:CR=1 FL=1|jgi:tRNA pseudouridine38-40 synthase|nr:tRNA pseudouridine(38-40) synthase TruA [Eubacterium sp.]MCH4047118.1 tRNA pseudouridine(38-40) synthase TruA [Eubacterium sp.]MCH4080215.1 tRNA pseudouridine(38-40) synthase TruA [Eubacterium sp.]MCH4111184.1 tRNA pseudouridine(38-40) synthase TruA [Eubacterium sp.]MCI1306846.1 tRNA pseudouridine(38-40) synthase TruA [Eubacterium sp.]